MAQSDLLRRYLDAGMAFTEMTRSRAEKIVRDFVRSGDISRKDANDRVEDLVERSRRNTEQLLDVVRKEVRAQMAALGFATQDDVTRLEAKIAGLVAGRASGASRPAPSAAAKASPSRAAKTTKRTKPSKAARPATPKPSKTGGA